MGGSKVVPIFSRGKSNAEVMPGFMLELGRHIGADTDVPANLFLAVSVDAKLICLVCTKNLRVLWCFDR